VKIGNERANHSGAAVPRSRWQKRSGWEVFEAEGVCPVCCGERERDSALSCARQRAGSGPAEIQVLDESWNMIETIDNEEARPPG
jgi:hypothetical protein